MAGLVQKFIVMDPAEASPIMPQCVALVNPDGTAFASPSQGAGIKAIKLLKNKTGKFVGGVATLSDGTTVDITVEVAS